MGKLTDSLKDTSQQLGKLKQGIQQMQALGEALAENTQDVAAAALRTGYAYATVEAAQADLATAQLQGGQGTAIGSAKLQRVAPFSTGTWEPWTLPTLKAEFGTAAKAYAHLKGEFEVSLRSRSWQNILEALNDALQQKMAAQLSFPDGALPHGSPLSPASPALAQRILALEQLVDQQSARIAQLEAQVQGLLRLASPSSEGLVWQSTEGLP